MSLGRRLIEFSCGLLFLRGPRRKEGGRTETSTLGRRKKKREAKFACDFSPHDRIISRSHRLPVKSFSRSALRRWISLSNVNSVSRARPTPLLSPLVPVAGIILNFISPFLSDRVVSITGRLSSLSTRRRVPRGAEPGAGEGGGGGGRYRSSSLIRRTKFTAPISSAQSWISRLLSPAALTKTRYECRGENVASFGDKEMEERRETRPTNRARSIRRCVNFQISFQMNF